MVIAVNEFKNKISEIPLHGIKIKKNNTVSEATKMNRKHGKMNTKNESACEGITKCDGKYGR